MHVLLTVADMDPATGGPPRVVAGTAKALAENGVRVTILTLHGERPVASEAWPELEKAGVKLMSFARSGFAPLGDSIDARRWIGENIADISAVHVHGVWERLHAQAMRAARKAGVPYAVSVHGMLDPWSLSQSRWKKQAMLSLGGLASDLRGAQAIIFGTQSEADNAARLGFVTRPAVVHNGVPLEVAERPRERGARERLDALFPSLSRAAPLGLFYSRIHPKKGIAELVEAIAAVADRSPDAGWLIAGLAQDQTYETELRERLKTHPARDRIVLTTQLSGPESAFVYDAVDYFILPSFQEGFSMAILEAMARRLPVLITEACHFAAVGEEGSGIVVREGVEGISAGLERMLALDPEARSNMGEQGNRMIQERFTWPKIAEQLVGLYGASK